MQVTKEKILTINEAYGLIKNRQKEGNLSYEQQNTLNYLEDLLKLDDKVSEKIFKELQASGLSEWQAAKTIDLMPKKEDQLQTILASSGQVDSAMVKKAFEIIKKYKKETKEPAKSKKVEKLPEEPKPEKEE